MDLNNKRRLRIGAGALAMACALGSTAAFAQDTSVGATPSGEPSDVIIVTGSRIDRPDLQASSPVSVISQETFQQFNSATVDKLLNQNPAVLPNSSPAVNNGSPGAATVDLRGLGDFRTLVLVNGKRMVSYDYNGVVDINAIPVALIKRVDVLTGGASAVYGSDAVSGVVNFILDEDFTGIRFDGSTEITTRGDGQVYDANLTVGVPLGDRGNLIVSGGYLKRKTVFQAARDYAKVSLSSDDLVSPGGSSSAVPTVFDNTFSPKLNNSLGNYYQVGTNNDLVPYYLPYNFQPLNYLITPQDRWVGTALLKYDLTDGVELFGRGTYLSSKVDSQSASTATFGYSFDIYPDNPFLTPQQENLFFNGSGTINSDGSTTVGIRRRVVESGGRTTTYDNQAWQVVGGLRGEFGSNYHWEAFGQYSKTKRDIAYLNDISYARVAQALDARLVGGQIVCRDPSNGCVPLNLFTTTPIAPDALAFISAQGAQTDRTEQWVAGASLSGDLFSISPWTDSKIGFAAGVEYRKERGSSTIDAAYASGDLIGYGQGQNFPVFSYDVKEVYGEMIIPVIEDKPFFNSVQIELGARYSDYSTVGSVFSWKAGGDWSPVEGVRFRGMFQRAVRAPNLFEYSAPQISSIENLDTDPCAGATPVGNATLTQLCIATGAPANAVNNGAIADPVSGQVNGFTGGNPNLEEEKSDTITAGVVITPPSIPGLSVSVDYFNIKIDNAIDTLGGSVQNVVTGCYLQLQDINSDYCQAIHRNTLTGSLSGNITAGVDQFQFNSVKLQTRGIDVGFNYSRDVGSYKASFAFNGTYTDKYSKQGVSFLPATECAGYFGFACDLSPLSKWKHVATATFGQEDWDLALRWRLLGAVHEDAGTDILASRLPAISYFDATVQFHVLDRATFRLGVENIFDEDPPLVGSAAGSTSFNAANTFPATYDPLGTTFFVGVTASY